MEVLVERRKKNEESKVCALEEELRAFKVDRDKRET